MDEIAQHDVPESLRADDSLPPGHVIGKFELRGTVSCGAASIVYRGWDRDLGIAVAVMEHRPAALMQRLPGGDLAPAWPGQQKACDASLLEFIRISRLLAHCHHPSLVRVLHLQFAHGTAYRVMPWIDGEPLRHLQRRPSRLPDEPALRALLDALLGAVEALHASGSAHGGVTPDKIVVQRDGSPMLLGPSTLSTAQTGATAQPWTDLRAVAEVLRFVIHSAPIRVSLQAADPAAAARESLSFHDRRWGYGQALLRVIDDAASPQGAQRMHTVAGFRAQLRLASQAAIGHATDPGVPPPAAPPVDHHPAPQGLRWPADGGRWRTRGAGVAAAGLILVLGLGVGLTFWAPEPTEQAEAVSPAVPVRQAEPPPASQQSATLPQAPAVPAPSPAPPPAEAIEPGPSAAVANESAPSRDRNAAAAAAAQTPRQACGPRTQFALYRCMQQQCEGSTWFRHPQCVSFRITDRVD